MKDAKCSECGRACDVHYLTVCPDCGSCVGEPHGSCPHGRVDPNDTSPCDMETCSACGCQRLSEVGGHPPHQRCAEHDPRAVPFTGYLPGPRECRL